MNKFQQRIKNGFNFKGFKTDEGVFQLEHAQQVIDELVFQERYNEINQRETDIIQQIQKAYEEEQNEKNY